MGLDDFFWNGALEMALAVDVKKFRELGSFVLLVEVLALRRFLAVTCVSKVDSRKTCIDRGLLEVVIDETDSLLQPP